MVQNFLRLEEGSDFVRMVAASRGWGVKMGLPCIFLLLQQPGAQAQTFGVPAGDVLYFSGVFVQ